MDKRDIQNLSSQISPLWQQRGCGRQTRKGARGHSSAMKQHGCFGLIEVDSTETMIHEFVDGLAGLLLN